MKDLKRMCEMHRRYTFKHTVQLYYSAFSIWISMDLCGLFQNFVDFFQPLRMQILDNVIIGVPKFA